jgi:hypothetical protein
LANLFWYDEIISDRANQKYSTLYKIEERTKYPFHPNGLTLGAASR